MRGQRVHDVCASCWLNRSTLHGPAPHEPLRMERPHTPQASRFGALPAGRSLSRVLLWICLLVVASIAAYGLHWGAAAMVSSAAADQLDRSYQALDGHDIREKRGALLQAASTSSTGMVLITGQDATTGDSRQVECVTANDRIASDALLVELKDLRAVAAQVCNVAIAPPATEPPYVPGRSY